MTLFFGGFCMGSPNHQFFEIPWFSREVSIWKKTGWFQKGTIFSWSFPFFEIQVHFRVLQFIFGALILISCLRLTPTVVSFASNATKGPLKGHPQMMFRCSRRFRQGGTIMNKWAFEKGFLFFFRKTKKNTLDKTQPNCLFLPITVYCFDQPQSDWFFITN